MIKTEQIDAANAKGWTLWNLFGWRSELWYCRHSVGAHCHPEQHVEIMPIWGRSNFCRINPATGKTQRAKIEPRSWFRLFSIPEGWPHWFEIEKPPVVFINFTKGPSPGQNFIPYGRHT